MKTASAAVLAILNTQGDVLILRADLYTFTLKNGSVLRYTDADHDMIVDGNTFVSGPIIKRSRTKQTVGVTVDTVQVTVVDGGTTLIEGKPIVHQFKNGYFKGATVSIQKMYLLDWNDTSPGPVDWFEGVMGAPSCDHMSAMFEVRSPLEMLNKQMPISIYQDTCNNNLYDDVCGANRASFTFAGTAGSAPDRKSFVLSDVTKPDAYFALGKVRFTSGQNAGQPARTVKSHISNVVQVFNPFPYDITPGDDFVIEAGCDKRQVSCGPAKFNRLSTGFQATPYIPVPETAVEGGGVSGTAASTGSTGTAVAGSPRTAGAAKGSYVP